MTPNNKHPLAGTTVPLVTVMKEAGRPDASAIRPLLAAMSTAGVDNLMLLGSNGEGALLDPSVTQEYVSEAVTLWRELRPGGRVLVNVSAAGTGDVMRRAESAMNADPDLLIVSPPSYFSHRDHEIIAHIRSLERFAVPYAVYNVPKYANALTENAFRVLLDESPTLVGMKDSSGSIDNVRMFLRLGAARPGIGLSQGDETQLVAALADGAVGIVPGTANIAPALAVALFSAMGAVDHGAAEALQKTTSRLIGMHKVAPGVPSVKAILRDRISIPDHVAPPLARCSDEDRAALLAFVADFEDHLIARIAG